VFTGDTVFIGGCGKFFEGSPDEMLKAMDLMNTLPLDTKIFCGHEYTRSNLKFCMKAEGSINP
jgi:hydroxyacylglutathione hydrolase